MGFTIFWKLNFSNFHMANLSCLKSSCLLKVSSYNQSQQACLQNTNCQILFLPNMWFTSMHPLEIQWGGKSTDLIDSISWIHSFSCYIYLHTKAYNIDAEIFVRRSIEDYVDVELEKLAVCLALPGQIKKKANSALEMLLNHDEHKVSEKNLVALFKKTTNHYAHYM